MKRIFIPTAALACLGVVAAETSAQYPSYQPVRPAAPTSLPSSNPVYGVRPAAAVAMRPTTTTYAAQPTNYQLKPVNPPSANVQRLLLANRTGAKSASQPTPAPPPTAAPAASSAGPVQQNWNSGMNAQPWDPTAAAPVAGPAPAGPDDGAPAADGACETCGCGRCGIFGWRCGFGGLCGHRCCVPVRSTGDLVQHMPFFGTTHGYYYFRPYHVMHVFSQQELATRWGGDPRNPYDNSPFQRIYEQAGVAAPKTTPGVVTTAPAPTTQEYVVPGSQQIVPTPVPGYMPTPQYVPGQPSVSPGVPGASPTPLPPVEFVPPSTTK